MKKRYWLSMLGLVIVASLGLLSATPACAKDPLNGCPAPDVSRFPTVEREEIIARAQEWVDSGMRYNQKAWNLVDVNTGRRYRQDCSGYASYVLRGSNCWTTVNLDKAATVAISKDELRFGDLINNKAPGNAGHVVVFDRWVDSDQEEYWGYDFSTKGIQHRIVTYPFKGLSGFEPRRYKNVCSEGSRFIAQSDYPTVAPGERFQIWFELENSGSCPWQSAYNYSLENVNGESLGAPSFVDVPDRTEPGQRQRWTLDMVAPAAPGEYVTEWRMTHAGYAYGDAPWIRVTVAAAPSAEEPEPQYGDGGQDDGSSQTEPEYAPAATWYRADPGSFVCDDIIGLEFTTQRDERRIYFNAAKCDFSEIKKNGRLYIVADNGSQFGPIDYSAGSVVISGSFDPIGDLGLTGQHRYEAHVYPYDQDYPIVSPPQWAWEETE